MKWTHLPISLLLVLGGCGGGGGGGGDEDTTTDTVDDSVDTATDPGDDTIVPDSEEDPTEDPVPDTAEDVPADTAADTPADTPSGGIVGDPCTRDEDCDGIPGSGAYCLEEIRMGPGGATLEFPGGYCTSTCSEDGDCGTGATCRRFGGEGRCLRDCADDSDCRESEGYVCRTIMSGTDTFCLPDYGGGP